MKKRTVSLYASLACLGIVAGACGAEPDAAEPVIVAGAASAGTEGVAGAASAGTEGVAGAASAGTEGVAGAPSAGTEGVAGAPSAGTEGIAGAASAGTEGVAGAPSAGTEGVAGAPSAGASAGAGAAGAADAGASGEAGTAGTAGSEAGADGVEAMTFSQVRAFLSTPVASHAPCFACHEAGGDLPQVFRDDDTLYDTLMSKTIERCDNRALVVPGDPSSSALYLVLTGECGTVGRMPSGCFQDQFENNCAPAEQTEAIRLWILAGAQP